MLPHILSFESATENFENNVTDLGTNSGFCHFLLVLRLGDIHRSLSIHAVPCSFLPCELIEMWRIQDLVARGVFIFYFFFSSDPKKMLLNAVIFSFSHRSSCLHSYVWCPFLFFLLFRANRFVDCEG